MDLKRHGCNRRSIEVESMDELEHGNTYTLNLESQDEVLAYVDSVSMRDDEHVLLLSRLPQRRLMEHVDLDKVEAYWVTNQQVNGTIQPSLDQIHDLVVNRISNHKGLAIIEGIEWLISMHGFSPVLNMIMRIKDSLHRKPWSILLVVSSDIFDDVQSAKWLREAPSWSIPKKVVFEDISETITSHIESVDEIEEAPISEDGSNRLVFLTRIPKEGYSKEIARKRILQWRRMGLDVSAAEPALFHDSDTEGFNIYKSVEDKVRRAVELDNRLELLLERGHRSEVTKLRFRIRQLTGLEDVEKRINELI